MTFFQAVLDLVEILTSALQGAGIIGFSQDNPPNWSCFLFHYLKRQILVTDGKDSFNIKHGDLTLTPATNIKRHTWEHALLIPLLGRWKREDIEFSGQSTWPNHTIPGSSRIPYLKNKVGGTWEMMLQASFWPRWVPSCTHTQRKSRGKEDLSKLSWLILYIRAEMILLLQLLSNWEYRDNTTSSSFKAISSFTCLIQSNINAIK